MVVPEIIFWCSLFSVFYAYLGYIGLLWAITLIKNDPVKKESITPSVSLIISVYNEENILSRKIENALDLNYPRHLLEIAIISDGSTDESNDIIRKYAQRDRRIRPYIAPRNKGKTACLNDFVPKLRGEVILFSDANSFYHKDLIFKIVRSFADDRVGFITGSTKYFTSFGGKEIEATNLYSRLEKITKAFESKIGSCVGADGAVFAIRRHLYKTLGPHDMNDFGMPLNIIKQGYRGVLDHQVYCCEEAAATMKGELRRHIRITNRTVRAILNHADLLNPLKYPIFSFQILSHKLFKLLVPFFMLLLLFSNIVLAVRGSHFYQVCVVFQIVFYGCAFFQRPAPVKSGIGRIFALCHSFVYINGAIFWGWVTYLSGETYSTWTPERT